MTQYRTIRLRVPVLVAREPEQEVTTPEEAAAAIRAFLDKENAPRDREVFGILALNARGKVIGAEVVSIGTATAALVHPREVFRGAISLGAISLIAWHTHPSGDPSPSPEDRMLHDRLIQAGEVLGIPVVDGLVLGGDHHFTMGGAA